jgi:hypothetical protein
VTPRFSRPNTSTCWPVSREFFNRSTRSGSQISSALGNLKPGGSTPTIWADTSLARIVRPITPESEANRVRHAS